MIPSPTLIERTSIARLRRSGEPRSLGAVVAAVVGTLAAPALAQPTPSDDLFQQGKALMAQGSLREACQKLAESLALNRRGGTLLNLAVCREKEGRYATALALLQEAREFALKSGRADRAAAADEAIERVRPRLSWLSVRLSPGAEVLDLAIRRDGEELPRQSWGTLLAIDPGRHTVVAIAPGRAQFESMVVVGEAGDKQVVEIPRLGPRGPQRAEADRERVHAAPERASAAANTISARPAPAAPAAQAWSWSVGMTAVSVGALAFGAGAASGVIAIVDSDRSKRLCPNDVCPAGSAGTQQNRDAHTAAALANVTILPGLAIAGAGVYLLVRSRAPRPGPKSLPRLVPTAAYGSAVLSLRGVW